MTATVKAKYANGVLTPLEPLDLEEGREVTVSIEEEPLVDRGAAMLRLVDRLHADFPDPDPSGPPRDRARNYKHYLYGRA